MIGWIDHEHVPGERRPGETLGHHLPARGERGLHVLGEPRIVQRHPGLGMTDHQPRLVSVGERDLVHRAEPTDLGEQGERVVTVVDAIALNMVKLAMTPTSASIRAIEEIRKIVDGD